MAGTLVAVHTLIWLIRRGGSMFAGGHPDTGWLGELHLSKDSVDRSLL